MWDVPEEEREGSSSKQTKEIVKITKKPTIFFYYVSRLAVNNVALLEQIVQHKHEIHPSRTNKFLQIIKLSKTGGITFLKALFFLCFIFQ